MVRAHLEFRFPPFGAITQRGVHVELRQALEPWHVTGEEATAAAPRATWIRRSSGCK
jgi:uncharacterized protein (DUF2126 family)